MGSVKKVLVLVQDGLAKKAVVRRGAARNRAIFSREESNS